tara:strand:- start:7 stop:495 length:489 start_codon:yes stop_codon:yes gene_type:complete
MKNILLVIFSLFISGCSEILAPEITCVEGNCDNQLELTTDYELDENGYYHFQLTGEFDESTYGRVNVFSNPVERVHWASVDSFTVYHMGFPITEPIIQHSIYTDDTGYGNQHFWIDLSAVGDTLSIYGSVNSIIQTCEWYDGVEGCEYEHEETIQEINVIIK